MSNRSATFAKRQREQNLKDKARQRETRRAERKATTPERGPTEEGIDPDLVGIVAGPQPREDDGAGAIDADAIEFQPPPGRSDDSP